MVMAKNSFALIPSLVALIVNVVPGVLGNDLNIYTATVNSPSSPISYLVTGNSLLENLYSSFNATGILALGTIFLAASGLFALKRLPPPNELKHQVESWKKDPLGFIPNVKGFGRPKQPAYSHGSNSIPNAFAHHKKDITFNYDIHGYDPYDNSKVHTTPNTYPRAFDAGSVSSRIESNYLSDSPGPPYTNYPTYATTVKSTQPSPVGSRRHQIVMKIQNAHPSEEKSLFSQIRNALTDTIKNFSPHDEHDDEGTESGHGEVVGSPAHALPVYDFLEPKPRVTSQYIPYLRRHHGKIRDHSDTQYIKLERKWYPNPTSVPLKRHNEYSTKFPWNNYY